MWYKLHDCIKCIITQLALNVFVIYFVIKIGWIIICDSCVDIIAIVQLYGILIAGVLYKKPHPCIKCPSVQFLFATKIHLFQKILFSGLLEPKKKNLNLVSLESLDSTLSNDIKLNFFDSKRPEKNKVDTFLIRREYHNTVVIQEEHITQFVLEGYNESHKVTSTTERKAENNARLPRSSMLCWPMREYLTLLEENSKSSTPCWGLT